MILLIAVYFFLFATKMADQAHNLCDLLFKDEATQTIVNLSAVRMRDLGEIDLLFDHARFSQNIIVEFPLTRVSNILINMTSFYQGDVRNVYDHNEWLPLYAGIYGSRKANI